MLYSIDRPVLYCDERMDDALIIQNHGNSLQDDDLMGANFTLTKQRIHGYSALN